MDFSQYKSIAANVAKIIVGKQEAVELLLIALLAEGHVLLEDVPGLGKTLMAKALAKSIGGSFRRVQFTPDLLPADITGFNVYDPKNGEFKFQPGPILTNILLADEINRTIPRTQASLLEGMGEGQVTVDGVTLPLPRPFLVIATQNPIELEGTFPLPEAQLDRFLLRVTIGYPSKDEELCIMDRYQMDDPLPQLKPVITPEQIIEFQVARRNIRIAAPVRDYIVDIIEATRNSKLLRFGVSPRGSLSLMRTSQALAALRGRDYVLPDDVKYLVEPVLAHRLSLRAEERIRGVKAETVLAELLTHIPVPTI
jgi:MoxR-like ATPase